MAFEAQKVQKGDYIEHTPASDVAAGQVVVVGTTPYLVGVADRDIKANALGAIAIRGIYDVASASATTFGAGGKVYWDDSGNLATATTTDKFMGFAIKPKINGETSVRVELARFSGADPA